MPRVAGLNIVAVLAAAVAFYAVGMVIYGFVFMEAWGQQQLINHGVPEADATALRGTDLFNRLNQIPGAMSAGVAYGLGFLVSLVTTLGIAIVMKLTRPASLGAALGTAFVLYLCFGGTTLAYNVLYSTESKVIFGIDLLHFFLAYHAAAAVLFLIDGKAMGRRTAQ
jgi:hypothetical protein